METKIPEIIFEDAIIKADNLDPVAVFTGGGIDLILKEIERQVADLDIDLETTKGRKKIASTARKVSKSKVLLDNLGKELVADWKAKAKKVDATRKHARDFLDNLRDTVRQPLTEWEEAEKARQEEERKRIQFELDYEEALAENALFDREREIARKEAELARIEAERKAKEEAERLEKERIEREERLKKEAAEKAKREAEVKAAEEAARIEVERKAANKAHQAKINREAMEDLIASNWVTEEGAKNLVIKIAKGQIRNITINY